METARAEAAGWLDRESRDPAWLEAFRRTWADRYGLVGIG
jgi:hypothetical protein